MKSLKSTRQNEDDAAAHHTREPAQTAMADRRPALADQQRQVAAMHNGSAAVAQQQRAGTMTEHTEQRFGPGGAGALQLMAADGQGVAQLGLLDWLKGAFGAGKDAKRRLGAKKEKLKQDAGNYAKGVVKGGGFRTRYQALGAKSEEDIHNDMLDEEAADSERLKQHPLLEIGRMALSGTAGLAIDAGADALNAVAPVAGTAVGKVAGMGKDKLDEMAKAKIGEDTNPYKVLRDNEEDD